MTGDVNKKNVDTCMGCNGRAIKTAAIVKFAFRIVQGRLQACLWRSDVNNKNVDTYMGCNGRAIKTAAIVKYVSSSALLHISSACGP